MELTELMLEVILDSTELILESSLEVLLGLRLALIPLLKAEPTLMELW